MAIWLTARQVRYAVLQCKVGKDGGRKRAVRGHGRDEDVRHGDAPDQGGRRGTPLSYPSPCSGGSRPGMSRHMPAREPARLRGRSMAGDHSTD